MHTERLCGGEEHLERAQVLLVRALELHREAVEVGCHLVRGLRKVGLADLDRVGAEERVDEVVCLVNDDHAVVEVQRERLARVLLEEQVVRQRNELCVGDGAACAKVGAHVHLLAERDELLDVADVCLGECSARTSAWSRNVSIFASPAASAGGR